MLGGANLVAGVEAYTHRAEPKGLKVLGYGQEHTAPVRWTGKDGCAVWVGRDGYIVPVEQLCKCVSKKQWAWLFTTHDSHGTAFDADHVADDDPLDGEEPNILTMQEVLDEGKTDPAHLHLDGTDAYVYSEKDQHEGKPANWCGNTPHEESFVVTPGLAKPDPYYDAHPQTCYTLSARCFRLMLVQNAKWKGRFNDGQKCFDFDHARVRWLDHKDLKARQEALEFVRIDHEGSHTEEIGYANGERPLYYRPGIMENYAQEGWRDKEDAWPYWPIAISMVKDDEMGYDPGLVSSFGWGGAPDGESVPAFKGKFYRGGSKSTPWSDGEYYRFWKAHSDTVSVSEKVKAALESQKDIGRRLFGGNSNDEDAMPLPYDTAFDMILACRTWYWNRFASFKRYPGRENNHQMKWRFSGRGYLNTQVAGYLYQLAPAKPA